MTPLNQFQNIELPPGIDRKKIIEFYEGDFNIYLPVLRAYADEMPAAVDKLRDVSAETLQNYARVMHGIKGTSASACAEEARAAAVKLETMAKSGDISGVLSQNKSFIKYMDDLASGIRGWFVRVDGH